MEANNQVVKEETYIQTVGGMEMDIWGGEDSQQGSLETGQGSRWWSGQSHVCVWVYWGEQLGSKTDCATHGSSVGK